MGDAGHDLALDEDFGDNVINGGVNFEMAANQGTTSLTASNRLGFIDPVLLAFCCGLLQVFLVRCFAVHFSDLSAEHVTLVREIHEIGVLVGLKKLAAVTFVDRADGLEAAFLGHGGSKVGSSEAVHDEGGG